MLRRLPNWRTRLHEYLASCAHRLFEYGQWDCVLHGADAVHAMTGEDLAAEIRGKYTTDLGAIRLMRRMGYEDVGEILDEHFERVPRAGEGDLGVFTRDNMPFVAVMGRGVGLGCRPDVGLWTLYEEPVTCHRVPH